MPRIIPEPRYFSIPPTVVGGIAFRKRALGADHVIDYSSKDFMAGSDRYDVIIDAVGKSSFALCRPLLAPAGTYVTTLPTPGLFFWSGVQSIAGIFGDAKRAKAILVRPSGKDLAFLCQLADEGIVTLSK